jgi:hypothetical protein
MQCLTRDRSAITPANAPNRGDPPTVESTGAAGKRAAEEGRTPKADVMHPTHGCCGRDRPDFCDFPPAQNGSRSGTGRQPAAATPFLIGR